MTVVPHSVQSRKALAQAGWGRVWRWLQIVRANVGTHRQSFNVIRYVGSLPLTREKLWDLGVEDVSEKD